MIKRLLCAAILIVAARFAAGQDVERTKPVMKCIIFRDVEAEKVQQAVLNFLATDPKIVKILQTESQLTPHWTPSKYQDNILTITIFYREKQ